MKTRIAVFVLAALAAASIGFAKEPLKKISTEKQKIESATINILNGLRTGNEGVVEAAMMMMAKIKMSHPDVKTAEVQTVMDSLSIAHQSYAIRYKAYLASSICADPVWFSEEQQVTEAEVETFFLAAAKRLQYKLFGMSAL